MSKFEDLIDYQVSIKGAEEWDDIPQDWQKEILDASLNADSDISDEELFIESNLDVRSLLSDVFNGRRTSEGMASILLQRVRERLTDVIKQDYIYHSRHKKEWNDYSFNPTCIDVPMYSTDINKLNL